MSLVDNSETPDNVELHYRRVVLAQCLVGSWDLGFLRKSNFVNGIRILKQSYFVQQEMQLDCFGNVLVVPGYRFCCCEGLSRKSSSKRCLRRPRIPIGDRRLVFRMRVDLRRPTQGCKSIDQMNGRVSFLGGVPSQRFYAIFKSVAIIRRETVLNHNACRSQVSNVPTVSRCASPPLLSIFLAACIVVGEMGVPFLL